MDLEREESYRDLQNLHDKCRKCLYYHVNLTMKDGSTFDGIIENVEPDRIIVLVGKDVIDRDDDNKKCDQQRIYNQGYYRYPMRYRYFNRQAFPLGSLATLSLLSYPYIAPPYPYYNPYYPFY
ncbi:hypothetical protein [Clostridium sp.]|uniref:hypothetical protein n=1 Tax=Clostridium sp. TaxID=1506 RepID=UPI00283ED73D|nr:hypothetical protein [Clostridium sp.]MDR3594404.1 hypothetical protein [Clostridium sp.]